MKNFLKSFVYAWSGVKTLALAERNFKIELAFAVLAVILSLAFNIEYWQWGLVILSISLVFLAELFNTAIEKTLDLLHPDHSEKVRDIKDLSAGAVLLTVFFAVFIGLLIFIPHIYLLFK